MFTEKLAGLYGASSPSASPFHRAQQKWPAHKTLKQNTSYSTPPLEIHICLILKVSEFSPLLLSIFQRKSDSQQALRQESLSTCLLTHISPDLVHSPCVSPFVICEWKKRIPHALLSMQRDIRCICRNPQPRGPMKAAFLCSHVPLPLISSYFTRGAVNRPLSLPSPSSYRLKRGNHDSDPSSSILSSFLLNLSVL